MNAQEAEAAVKEIPYDPKNRKAYNEARTEVEIQFMDWLASEHAGGFTKEQQKIIWMQAWSDGHSGGYGDVENCYIRLADFAWDIVDAR